MRNSVSECPRPATLLAGRHHPGGRRSFELVIGARPQTKIAIPHRASLPSHEGATGDWLARALSAPKGHVQIEWSRAADGRLAGHASHPAGLRHARDGWNDSRATKRRNASRLARKDSRVKSLYRCEGYDVQQTDRRTLPRRSSKPLKRKLILFYFSFAWGVGRVSGRGAASPFVAGALSGIHIIDVRSYL